MAHSCKDDNVRWKGFEDDEIKKLFEQSFQKEETVFQALMKHLVTQRYEFIDSHTLDLTKIELEVLRYHMDLGIKICKSKLKNYVLSYMQLYMPDRYKFIDYIYHYTMNN